ncbi:laminin G domain protein [Oesophagostomum dentatum]|uniref:Laminin G domain protein n=1 Tax=Oesophagostomum dentatum TaxID=61180 RepID=A0A0B1SP61_OESDE|nr:laminin G domain protein [Oesophagostomum dentatum]
MKVDRQSWVESQLLSIGGVLTQPGMLYIGGFDGSLPDHLATVSGFHGCVRKIRLNGKSAVLRAGAGQHVRECGMDPCATAACPKSCTSSNDDFVCLCEWPRYGKTCEQEATRLSAMRFTGHSYLEFRSEEHMNQSESPVTLHQWHKAEVWRTGKGILMKVDRQSWVESQLLSIGGVLTQPGMLYIGGFDGSLPDHLATVSGFHGCVRKIRLNGKSVVLRAGSGQHVRECGMDPCATAACPKSCTSSNDDFVCLCEWPRYGKTCEQEATRLSAMRFTGHSYLEFRSEEHMNQITGDSLNMEINVKLNNNTEEDGMPKSQLLAFTGENGITGDFFRLLITQDKTVQVMMNLGSGLVSLTHPTQIIPNRWTRIEVVRKRRQLTLSVNDATPITTMAPGESEQLNVYKGLFIGGMPPDAQHLDGFRGCIESIEIGSVILDHPKQATTAINIQDCDS